MTGLRKSFLLQYLNSLSFGGILFLLETQFLRSKDISYQVYNWGHSLSVWLRGPHTNKVVNSFIVTECLLKLFLHTSSSCLLIVACFVQFQKWYFQLLSSPTWPPYIFYMYGAYAFSVQNFGREIFSPIHSHVFFPELTEFITFKQQGFDNVKRRSLQFYCAQMAFLFGTL